MRLDVSTYIYSLLIRQIKIYLFIFIILEKNMKKPIFKKKPK